MPSYVKALTAKKERGQKMKALTKKESDPYIARASPHYNYNTKKVSSQAKRAIMWNYVKLLTKKESDLPVLGGLSMKAVSKKENDRKLPTFVTILSQFCHKFVTILSQLVANYLQKHIITLLNTLPFYIAL